LITATKRTKIPPRRRQARTRPDAISEVLRATAIHEAGHAVIGRVLALSCGGATIIPNEAELEAGHANVKDPLDTLSVWEQRDWEKTVSGVAALNCRDGARAAYRGSILATMAGAEAEVEILGRCRGGDGDDRYKIEGMAASSYALLSNVLWHRYEPRMRRQTRRLVRKHRDKIERVAAALKERRTLKASDIDALM
jgi:hypothetical protein